MKSSLLFAVQKGFSLVTATFENFQTILEDDGIEDRAGSGPYNRNRNAVSDEIYPPGFFDKLQQLKGNSSTIIGFDDLELALPVAPITRYSMVTLGGFQFMNAPLAYENDTLALQDLDCALSPPNVLSGSRSDRSIWPRISLATVPGQTSVAETNEFRLVDLGIKALGYVPIYSTVVVQGWKIEEGVAVDSAYLSRTYLREGHQIISYLDLQRWPSWQKEFTVIEMWAETRTGEDLEFCIDDLQLEIVD